VPVVDGLVEDRREAGGELADHRRAERPDASPATVAQHGAGLNRAPKICGFLKLVRLERDAEVSVDLVQLVLAQERQQVVGET
jgi:hypothetical protein